MSIVQSDREKVYTLQISLKVCHYNTVIDGNSCIKSNIIKKRLYLRKFYTKARDEFLAMQQNLTFATRGFSVLSRKTEERIIRSKKILI